jgi:hypothetical protein
LVRGRLFFLGRRSVGRAGTNRHQLRQREQARGAFRKAVEWIEEEQRKAEDNALLRFQYEGGPGEVRQVHLGGRFAVRRGAGRLAASRGFPRRG